MVVLISIEKMMEKSLVLTIFNYNESARPPTLPINWPSRQISKQLF